MRSDFSLNTVGANSVEHRNVMILYKVGTKCYIFVLQVYRDFLPCYLFGAFLYFSLCVTFMMARGVRYKTASGSGKYIV